MNKSLRILTTLFALFFSIQSLAGYTKIETENLKDVLSHLGNLDPAGENILVIFDIDKTLLLVQDCKLKDPKVKSFIRWLVNVKVCPTDLTETRIVKDIESIQKEGFHTVSLTARKNNLIAATERELDRHGIEFEGMPFTSKENFKDISNPKMVIELRDGVIYASGKAKGKVLTAFLKKYSKANYAKVIFIDDSIKNVKSLRRSFAKRKDVDLTVFHYTRYVGH